MLDNPFILNGYESEETFCDRETETETLLRALRNGNNVSLIAPRRIGKTGLIEHLFHQPEVICDYYTILIDIYATKSLDEMVGVMGKSILKALVPKGKKAVMTFINSMKSLRSGIGFDIYGNPSWNVEFGDIHEPKITLDEIFHYLETADKPCIIAIDEFQVISTYQEHTVEAMMRTYIQHCHHARFIYSGSQRTMMGNMFLSASRPFYQSAMTMELNPIDIEKYLPFAVHLFKTRKKDIDPEVVHNVYDRFEGVTWYVQRVMNELYSHTLPGERCTPDMIDPVVDEILDANNFIYQSILFRLPARQKALLIAICKSGKASQITSSSFINRYKLLSASSVQSAIKGLLEKEFVTSNLGVYELYDKFFCLWLLRQ